MSSTNQPRTETPVEHHPPSRPGIKFVLCVVAALIFLAVIIIRG